MKEVEYDYWTGHFNYVLELLNRSIGAYEGHGYQVKVGITGRDPQVRFNEHLARDNSWKRMVVKYRTTSENYVNAIEDYFIITRPELANAWIGKSNLADGDYKYLYFLLK